MLKKVIVLMLLVIAVGVTAATGDQPNGQPFDALWNALSRMADRVAALEANAPGPTAPRIVDTSGRFVAWADGLREIDGRWFLLSAGTEGFVEQSPVIWYTGEHCDGTAYLAFATSPWGWPGPAHTTPLASTLFISEGVGYFAAEPFEQVEFRSIFDRGCFNDPTRWGTLWGGRLATYDVTRLGVSPPFHLE